MKAKAYKCDVGDQQVVAQTFKEIDQELGPVTGLIAVGISTFKNAHILTRNRTRVYLLLNLR